MVISLKVLPKETKTINYKIISHEFIKLASLSKLIRNVCDVPAVANTSELLALFRSRWPIAQWEQTGYFSEEFLHKINPYWMRFPPPDPQSHYALAIIYAVVMTIGVTGNSLVICMFIRYVSGCIFCVEQWFFY